MLGLHFVSHVSFPYTKSICSKSRLIVFVVFGYFISTFCECYFKLKNQTMCFCFVLPPLDRVFFFSKNCIARNHNLSNKVHRIKHGKHEDNMSPLSKNWLELAQS